MNTQLHLAKRIGLAFFVFLFFFPCGAMAAQPVIQPMVESDATSEGRIRVAPKLSLGSRYDSNFFKTADNEREVLTWLIQPGIEMAYQTAKSRIALGYSLDGYFYTESDTPAGKLDADEENYVGHTFAFNGTSRISPKLTLELDDVFNKTREDSKSDTFAVDVERQEYYINRLTPGLLYQWNERLSSGLKYRNTITEYDGDNNTGSSVENRGIFDLTYYFTPTSSLGLVYNIWDRNYDVDVSDYTSSQVGLLYKRQIKDFGFEIGGGYHNRSFDESSVDSLDLFYYSLGVKTQMARTSGSLFLEQNYNDAISPSDLYSATRLRLNVGHDFGQKLKGGVSGFYQMNEYEDWGSYKNNRDDDLFGVSANITYKFIQWMAMGLEGGFESRDSNISVYDYDNGYVMFKLDMIYDAVRR